MRNESLLVAPSNYGLASFTQVIYKGLASRDPAPALIWSTIMTPAEILAAAEALRAEYREYAAEARACGYEVLTFEEWAGAESPKEAAAARWQYHFDNDTLDLY